MLPFLTQYQSLVSTRKEAFMEKWNLIQNQPLLCQILKKQTSTISYKERKNHGQERASSVRAKILKVNTRFHPGIYWMCIL